MSRSNRTKDDSCYLEITKLDLEEKYGHTESGRPVASLSFCFLLLVMALMYHCFAGNTWRRSLRHRKANHTLRSMSPAQLAIATKPLSVKMCSQLSSATMTACEYIVSSKSARSKACSSAVRLLIVTALPMKLIGGNENRATTKLTGKGMTPKQDDDDPGDAASTASGSNSATEGLKKSLSAMFDAMCPLAKGKKQKRTSDSDDGDDSSKKRRRGGKNGKPEKNEQSEGGNPDDAVTSSVFYF